MNFSRILRAPLDFAPARWDNPAVMIDRTPPVGPGRTTAPASSRIAAAVFQSRREDDFVAWRAETPHDSASGPCLARQGHVFLTDGQNLVRVNPDGQRAWTRPLAKWTHFQPAARPDGGAVCAAQGRGLTSWNPDGTESWTWGRDLEINSVSPALGPDGAVYVCARQKDPHQDYLVALNPDGTERWRAELSMYSSAPPVVHPDGRVSVRLDDDKVASVGPDGTPLWERALPGERVQSRPSGGPDGSVWVGAQSGKVFQITPDGQSHEFFQAVGEIRGAPRVLGDGKVYFTTMRGMVYCVDGAGKQRWMRSLGGILETPVTRMADGTLIVASYEKTATALNPDGTTKWQTTLPVAGDDAIPVDSYGTAYFAGGGALVAVNPAGPRVDLENLPEPEVAGEIAVEEETVRVGGITLPVNRQVR